VEALDTADLIKISSPAKEELRAILVGDKGDTSVQVDISNRVQTVIRDMVTVALLG
jgi:hypothetical protein